MPENKIEDESYIRELYKCGIIKYGDFTLKSGKKSNIYFNLRELISYPNLLKKMSDFLYQKIVDSGIAYDSICGLAYTGIPIATSISLDHNIPMIVVRKERKEYGTKQLVEGSGKNCILIDDLITSGSSIRENIEKLREEGINVVRAVVLIDRSAGAEIDIGVEYDYVYKMEDILEILPKIEKQFKRIDELENPKSKELYNIMIEKGSRLCYSADVRSYTRLKSVIELVAPYVCMVKLHLDLLDSIDIYLIKWLKDMARKYNFMIMEDRKFADIGKIVTKQLNVHRMRDWVDFVTAHGIMGEKMLEAFNDYTGGVFLIAQVSSEGNLIEDSYTKSIVDMAKNNPGIVSGFITQERFDPKFLHATPGVNLDITEGELGQRYKNEVDTDIVIVGSGIYDDNNDKLVENARRYRDHFGFF